MSMSPTPDGQPGKPIRQQRRDHTRFEGYRVPAHPSGRAVHLDLEQDGGTLVGATFRAQGISLDETRRSNVSVGIVHHGSGNGDRVGLKIELHDVAGQPIGQILATDFSPRRAERLRREVLRESNFVDVQIAGRGIVSGIHPRSLKLILQEMVALGAVIQARLYPMHPNGAKSAAREPNEKAAIWYHEPTEVAHFYHRFWYYRVLGRNYSCTENVSFKIDPKKGERQGLSWSHVQNPREYLDLARALGKVLRPNEEAFAPSDDGAKNLDRRGSAQVDIGLDAPPEFANQSLRGGVVREDNKVLPCSDVAGCISECLGEFHLQVPFIGDDFVWLPLTELVVVREGEYTEAFRADVTEAQARRPVLRRKTVYAFVQLPTATNTGDANGRDPSAAEVSADTKQGMGEGENSGSLPDWVITTCEGESNILETARNLIAECGRRVRVKLGSCDIAALLISAQQIVAARAIETLHEFQREWSASSQRSEGSQTDELERQRFLHLCSDMREGLSNVRYLQDVVPSLKRGFRASGSGFAVHSIAINVEGDLANLSQIEERCKEVKSTWAANVQARQRHEAANADTLAQLAMQRSKFLESVSAAGQLVATAFLPPVLWSAACEAGRSMIPDEVGFWGALGTFTLSTCIGLWVYRRNRMISAELQRKQATLIAKNRELHVGTGTLPPSLDATEPLSQK